MVSFHTPYFLLLIPLLIYIFYGKQNVDSIKVPGIQILKKNSKKTKKHLIGKFFIFLSLVFMTIALARPQTKLENRLIKKDGI